MGGARYRVRMLQYSDYQLCQAEEAGDPSLDLEVPKLRVVCLAVGTKQPRSEDTYFGLCSL